MGFATRGTPGEGGVAQGARKCEGTMPRCKRRGGGETNTKSLEATNGLDDYSTSDV